MAAPPPADASFADLVRAIGAPPRAADAPQPQPEASPASPRPPRPGREDEAAVARRAVEAYVRDETDALLRQSSGGGGGGGGEGDDPCLWNTLFMRALELPEATPSEARAKYLLLAKVAHDFVETAKRYGRIILQELALPLAARTIRPLAVGVAGGLKFAVRGIFFKLAQDTPVGGEAEAGGGAEGEATRCFLYGGEAGANAEFANKAAANEMRGANRYLHAQLSEGAAGGGSGAPQLRVPMQVLVDARGFRLVCMPLLPIDARRAPVYGSADAGRSVHADDDVFARALAGIAEQLHLAPHLVPAEALPARRRPRARRASYYAQAEEDDEEGDAAAAAAAAAARARVSPAAAYNAPLGGAEEEEEEGAAHRMVRLHCAADVEGHVGRDQRRYLLDLARALPPEAPAECAHLPRHPQAVFFRLLRPELLAYLKRHTRVPPLSPDALSRWGASDPHAAEHNAAVREATRVLLQQVIPRVAADMAAAPPPAARLVDELHKRGVSARHLGVLLAHLPPTAAALRETVIVEAARRALKNVLRSWLRAETVAAAAAGGAYASDYLARRCAAAFLNLVGGRHPRAMAFWDVDVADAVAQRFGALPCEPERRRLAAARGEGAAGLGAGRVLWLLCAPHAAAVAQYALGRSGLALSEACRADLARLPAGAAPLRHFEFTAADVEEGALHAKHMALADLAEGRVLLQEALRRAARAAEDAAAGGGGGGGVGGGGGGGEGSGRPGAVRGPSREASGGASREADEADEAGVRRLLEQSALCFARALAADPASEQAQRSSGEALLARHAADRQPAAADAELLAELQRLLSGPADAALVLHVAAPLFRGLLRLWAARRASAPTSQHLGGATSLEALQKAQRLVAQCEAALGGGDAAASWDVSRLLRDAWRSRLACVATLWAVLGASDATLLQRLAQEPVRDFVSGDRAASLSRELRGGGAEARAALAALWGLFGEAAAAGEFALLGTLSELGVEVNGRDARGATPLERAVLAGSDAMVRALAALGAELEVPGAHGETPLLQLVSRATEAAADALPAQMALLRELLRRGASVNARSDLGTTPLHAAAARGAAQLVELLLEHGADLVAEDAAGCTPALLAALSGHDVALRALLRRAQELGVDCVNAPNHDGFTPLLAAADRGYAEAVRACLDGGASLETCDPAGRSPLVLAAHQGHLPVLQLLCAAAGVGAEWRVRDRGGRGLLSVAAAAGRGAVVRWLVERGARVEPPLHLIAQSTAGLTPLMEAAAGGHSECVAALLADPRLDARAVNYSDPASHWTALHHACAAGAADSAALLLRAGATVEARDRLDRTPLLLACERNRANVVALLLHADGGNDATRGFVRADLSSRNRKGSTCVGVCAESDAAEALDVVLRVAPPDFAGAKDDNKATPLMMAAYSDAMRAARRLLEAGQDANELQDYGKTALHYAAWRGHLGMAQLLVQFGARVDAPERDGRTPLFYAVAQRSSDLAAFLIEKGANPRTANKHRETPLHIAAAQGSAETVSLLLRAGADPEARDGKELTPLEVAQKAGRREAAAFLYEATGRDHAAVANHRKAPVTRSQPLPGLRAVLERLGEAGRAISAEPRPALAAAAAAAPPAAAAPANAPQRKQPATNERQQPHHILGHGGSALALAAYFGLEDVAKALLTARVPPDAPASEDVVSKLADEAPLLLLRDRSPLIIAAEQGHLGVVRLLLSHGADTARRTRHGHGPLSVAARDGHLAVVRELAGRGIGSDESDKWGMNPLHLAISQGEAAVAEALVSAFPAMLTARASDGLTAVALAASQENDTVLRSLLRREEARALVNATDVDGQTPLHVAAQQGHVSPVRTLVEHGAPVDARDREGTTPLMLACRRGNADVAAALLSLGADMNARDIHNQTALTACAIASRYSGNDEALRLLIARGADLSALTPQLRELPSVAAALKGVADRSRS